MQNYMFILRTVLKVMFTKYCTCAAESPGKEGQDSRDRTGFYTIAELETHMLKAYLRKKRMCALCSVC